jgi:hypothetical protein
MVPIKAGSIPVGGVSLPALYEGQVTAHCPVSQFDVPLGSLAKKYNVLPLASVRILPNFASAVIASFRGPLLPVFSGEGIFDLSLQAQRNIVKAMHAGMIVFLRILTIVLSFNE